MARFRAPRYDEGLIARRASRRAPHADHRLDRRPGGRRLLCFWQNHLLLDALNGPLPAGKKPITLSPAEPFLATFKVSVYAGILLALPILLYEAYAFVLPALSSVERRVILPFLLLVPALFVAGVAFGYYIVLPAALHFLLNFNAEQFTVQVRAADYYGFVTVTLLAMGIVFQVPMGILALTKLGITTPQPALEEPALRVPDPRDRRDGPAGHRPGHDARRAGAAAAPLRVLDRACPVLGTPVTRRPAPQAQR